ncbi:uncharacterized protein LOC106653010 [Trichogramma pretiosum]|uniref:uncharacterized protein LOC106653010 n=1 Tax=Trichogramma pretiosum TaxID=7493 RepID=UPI0006C9680D|nr:uncharacterized protein LOC106653010 [Trichogramma pretiosum]
MEKTGPIQSLSVEELKIINRWRFIRDLLIKIVAFGYSSGALFYLIPPLYFGEIPFPGYHKSEYLDSKWFATIAIIQIIATAIMVPAWMSFDIYLCTFLCQICKEFEIIHTAVQDLRGKNIATLHAIIRRHNRALEYGKKMRIIVHCTFFVINCCYGAYLIFGTIIIEKISWKTHGALAIKNALE